MNALLLILIIVALVAIQMLAGGRYLALCLPSYGLLAVAALLSWWHMRRVEIPRRVTATLAAGMLCFAYIALRAIFSPEEYLARKDLYPALAALTVYLLVALNVTSSKLRVGMVVVLLLLAAANVTIGAIQFGKGQNYMLFSFLPRVDYGTRASGFFGYPNFLAGFLEVALLMGLGVACWSRWRPWAKMVVGYFIAVCVAGIVLTGSRGGYVSSLAGLLVFGILSLLVVSKRIQKHSIYILIGGAVLALVLAWSVQRAVRQDVALQSRARTALEVDSTRFQLWNSAIKQFQLHPVFGAGSRFYLYYGREFRPAGVQADPVYTHNEYLQFLAEYGLVGMAGFLAFLGVHLHRGWKSFHSKISRESETLGVGSNSLALSTGALSAVAASLVHAVVDFNLHCPANVLVLAFVFGVLANPGGEIKQSSKEQKSGYRLGRHFRLVTPALGLCLLVFALPTLPAEYFGERARLVLSDWNYLFSPEVSIAAEDFARRGLRYDPKNPELYYYLGEAQVSQAAMTNDASEKTRLFSESAEAYRKAVELAPRDSRLLVCLATSLDAVQRFDEAAPVFVRSVELDPGSSTVRWAYAFHLELLKKLPEAEAEYRRSFELGGGVMAEMALERIGKLRKAQAAPPQPPAPVEKEPEKERLPDRDEQANPPSAARELSADPRL